MYTCMYIILCAGRQSFAADVPGQWVLEAKISSYKLYIHKIIFILTNGERMDLR